jgi:hypothetical protein
VTDEQAYAGIEARTGIDPRNPDPVKWACMLRGAKANAAKTTTYPDGTKVDAAARAAAFSTLAAQATMRAALLRSVAPAPRTVGHAPPHGARRAPARRRVRVRSHSRPDRPRLASGTAGRRA